MPTEFGEEQAKWDRDYRRTIIGLIAFITTLCILAVWGCGIISRGHP